MRDHDDFPRVLGQGPDFSMRRIAPMHDWLLPDWSNWETHDGRGLPAGLMGRRIMIAGLSHDLQHGLSGQDLIVTPEYAASDAAAVWDWSLGFGGVSGYRIRRDVSLLSMIDADVIKALDLGRGGSVSVSFYPLLLGLDGVA